MRRLLTTLFAMAIVGVAPAAAQRGGPASVFIEPVSERQFSQDIEALGTLLPREQVDLTLNAADRVTAIYFEDGERVRQGKTLLSLAQREQIALVEAAEADVEEARRQLERIARLADAEAVSRSERDAAQRNLDSAEANLRALQSRQSDRVLVAPFDGVLGFRLVSVGTFIRAGDVVATLIDDSEMNLDFDVPSTFLLSVRPGTPIIAQTDDLPDLTFEGTVATLDNRIDPVTRAVRVRAVLPNADQLLRSGMFMQVTVAADPRAGLAVPEAAIQPVGPKNYVWRVADESGQQVARRVEVQLGQRSDGYIEVVEGLSRSDDVIVEGIIRVREGSPIVVRDRAILDPGRSTVSGGGAASAGVTADSE